MKFWILNIRLNADMPNMLKNKRELKDKVEKLLLNNSNKMYMEGRLGSEPYTITFVGSVNYSDISEKLVDLIESHIISTKES